MADFNFDRFPRLFEEGLPPLPINTNKLNEAATALALLLSITAPQSEQLESDNPEVAGMISAAKDPIVDAISTCFLSLATVALDSDSSNKVIWDLAARSYIDSCKSLDPLRAKNGKDTGDELSMTRFALQDALHQGHISSEKLNEHLNRAADHILMAQSFALARIAELRLKNDAA